MSLFKRKPNTNLPNQEASGNFELEDLPALFTQIASLIPSGFGANEQDALLQGAKTLSVDEEIKMAFPIKYAGNAATLTVTMFMDDLDAPDVYFSAPSALAEAIDAVIDQFNEERGR